MNNYILLYLTYYLCQQISGDIVYTTVRKKVLFSDLAVNKLLIFGTVLLKAGRTATLS